MTHMRPRAVALVSALVLFSACATVKTNPTQPEIQQVRAIAVRVADSAGTIAQIADQAGKFIAALPIPDSAKTDYDCALVRVMGTSTPRPNLLTICGPSTPQGPGPLPQALTALKAVATQPELRATVTTIVNAVNPLLTKLDASPEAGIRGLAIGLRAALAVLQAFLGGTL